MDEVMNPQDATPLDRPIQQDGNTYTHSATGKTKAQTVADIINRLLQNLIIKCAKSEGVRDFFQVGVIGYGGGDARSDGVGPAFGGALVGRDLVHISELANSPSRIDERAKKVDDGAGGLVEQKIKFPIWFDAVCTGGTPMCAAIKYAHTLLADWTSQHPSSFPPICINITDGASTDGDPTSVASQLTSLATADGNVLFLNIHITTKQGAPVEFPDSDALLTDSNAKLLFGISSVLPTLMQTIARQEGLQVSPASRGFAFNADLVSLIRFLDIGTRASNLR